MSGLLALLKALLGIPGAIVALLRVLWRLLESLFHRVPEREGRLDKAAKTHCVPIEDPAMVTPDPLIYAQYDLMAHGLAVTWDNPDFGIFKDGLKVDSHDLVKNTTYDVVVRVWNASTDCPVVLMPVHLSYLEFGIGTTSHPIATKHADVGVKGGVNNPAYVEFAWQTPPFDGHYCLQALLAPASDLNYGNNLGQHNTDVVEAHSPATFSFPLRNATDKEHRYQFEVDGFEVQARPCRDGETGQGKHSPVGRNPGLPAGWAVDLTPPVVGLAPGMTAAITATITPPSTFVGDQVVNIHAFYSENHTDRLAGGVSVTVTKKP